MKFPIKKDPHLQNGFTLVELSITIVISSIIILSAACLVLISGNQLSNSNIDAQVIRDHSFISKILSNAIEEGLSNHSYIYTDSTQTSISNTGSCLKVTAVDSSHITFYKTGHHFKIIDNQGNHQQVVSHILNNLIFTNKYTNDSIRTIQVALTTNRNNNLINTQHNYSFRN